MRNWVIGIGVAAMAVGAAAQDASSKWGYFEQAGSPLQAGVQNARGAQLILKCDKPGKHQVYAVVVTGESLVPATDRSPFQMRPAEFRFDEGANEDDRWRFYEKSAVAIDQTTIKALTHFLTGLADAQKVRVRLNPDRGRWVEESFEVAGARDAINRVFTSCGDDNPIA
jgi:hypothetical protein